MKQIAVAVLMLSTLCGVLSADAYGNFTSLVQFHADIGNLVRQPQDIDPSRLYLVEGMITAIRIVNPEPETYYAEADCISAEWDEEEAIHTYRIVLVFSKPVFSDLLVSKGGQAIKPGQIGPSTRGLALIQFANIVPLPADSKSTSRIPVFIAHDFRILE